MKELVMVGVGLGLLSAASVLAQDGAAVYQARCASCHDAPTGRVPPVSALRAMMLPAILQALEGGSMQLQAKGTTAGMIWDEFLKNSRPMTWRLPPTSP